jgi:hypothetical protein
MRVGTKIGSEGLSSYLQLAGSGTRQPNVFPKGKKMHILMTYMRESWLAGSGTRQLPLPNEPFLGPKVHARLDLWLFSSVQ